MTTYRRLVALLTVLALARPTTPTGDAAWIPEDAR